MKTIGMIVAVEIQSVLKRYGAKLVKRKETASVLTVAQQQRSCRLFS